MPTYQATADAAVLPGRRLAVAEYSRRQPDYGALADVGALHAATLRGAAYGNTLWMNTVFGDERIFSQKGVVP